MHDRSLVSFSSPTHLTLLTSTQSNRYGTCSRIELPISWGLQIPLTNFGRWLKRYGRRLHQRRLESSLGPCRTELRLLRRQKDGIQSIDLAYISEMDVYTQIYKHKLISQMPSQKQLVRGGDDRRSWWWCPETFCRHKYIAVLLHLLNSILFSWYSEVALLSITRGGRVYKSHAVVKCKIKVIWQFNEALRSSLI